MKLMLPLGSRTAHLISCRDAIWFWRACSRTSSTVSRSRFMFLSIGSPSWTITIGLPSRTVRRKARVRNDDLEDGDRPDRDHRARERVVVLRQPLLDRVAQDDEQDQVERS